jgi:hypothetical protein
MVTGACCGVHAACERVPGVESSLMLCLVCQCDGCVCEPRGRAQPVDFVPVECAGELPKPGVQAQGEPSVYGRETARPVDGGYKKKGRQVAGKDYVHSDLCQARPAPAHVRSEAGSALVPCACHGLLRAPCVSPVRIRPVLCSSTPRAHTGVRASLLVSDPACFAARPDLQCVRVQRVPHPWADLLGRRPAGVLRRVPGLLPL